MAHMRDEIRNREAATGAIPNDSRQRLTFPFAYVITSIVMALIILGIVGATGGRFIYTLDDPYIHLSMSEQIAAGGYGVNANEFAAASSSILYPLLLAPASGYSWQEYLPLAIGIVCVLLSLAVIGSYLEFLGFMTTPAGRRGVAVIAVGFVLSSNIVGLAFSGMEHNLHILLAMLAIFGLTRFLDDGRTAWWLVPVLVLGPLVRYEALALSLACIGVLATRQAGRPALLALLGVVTTLGIFSIFLTAIGQGILPNSVIVKSHSVASGLGGTWGGTIAATIVGGIANTIVAFTHLPGLTIIGAAVTGLVITVRSRLESGPDASRRKAAATVLAVVALGHLAAGRFGWFHRYEVYAVVSSAMLIVYLTRTPLLAWWNRPGGMQRVVGIGTVLLAGAGFPYLDATFRQVPLAASNIYEQQYQMHRFVTEFHHGPVAVNDLGWVSYRNPDYVLDLWGLGSKETRMLREGDPSFGWIGRVTAASGADIAMIYVDWFPGGVPADWVPLATLRLRGERVTAAQDNVVFYATFPAAVEGLKSELATFGATLPPGVVLTLH